MLVFSESDRRVSSEEGKNPEFSLNIYESEVREIINYDKIKLLMLISQSIEFHKLF